MYSLSMMAYSAIPSDITKLKGDLVLHSKKLDWLKTDLSKLENDLGKKNSRYIQGIKRSKGLGLIMEKVRASLKENELSLKDNYQKIKRSLRLTIANGITQSEDIDETIKKKILVKEIKYIISQFNSQIAKNVSYQNELLKLRVRIKDYQTTETELQKIMNELEFRKKMVAENYFEEASKTRKIKNQLETAKGERIKRLKSGAFARFSKLKGKLDLPMRVFSRKKYKKKGVELFYKGVKPIYSIGKGRIIYIGDLSNYGNVILVDHGEDIRSVILGDLDIQVKKGDFVDHGSILGYTLDTGRKKSPLYFEIRRKNMAQNSKEWLKKRYI
ncbi:MAG: peptidoglycan DD-metalloendopeptidase family protein [Bacteriovoracaceae bacterium]|jgi:murein DD-endopeptidase MepM/ murein hydrolase activator NlpD|nr:peptidoglycan DD-metalloendopeptidase family protein [Bacteriovoracaceae bacterium]